MDNIWKVIQIIAKNNNGFIKTSDIESSGISRPMLGKYTDAGKLIQVRKGLYILADDIADEFALLQVQSSKLVFSYGTALYLWGLSDRTPHEFHITVPSSTNTIKLRKNNPNLKCHYVQREYYEIGITETRSPQGSMVRLYDKERCICDLILSKEQVDMQVYSSAIKEYFKSKPNHRRLLKYGKIFGIEEKIRTYMEVL